MVSSWASSDATLRSMLANGRRDTNPEMAVRRLLHAAGLRYRVDVAPVKSLRSRADIIFTRRRLAVFIDGCFWHCCPSHGTQPKTNSDYWAPKLARNTARDLEVSASLRASGWTVLRFWEHEDPTLVAQSIIDTWSTSIPLAGASEADPGFLTGTGR